MNNLARILVADDLDRETKIEPPALVQIATDLAESLGAELHLVHVYDIPHWMPVNENLALLEGPYVEAMNRSLDAEAERVRADHPGLKLVSAVEKGKAADVLLADIVAHDCQLVAVNTHKPSELTRDRLGPVAERVIRESRVPVLSINPNHLLPKNLNGKYRPELIVVSFDGHDTSPPHFEMALKLAQVFGARLELLHVVEEWAYPIVQSSALLAGGVFMPLELDLQEMANARNSQLQSVADRCRALGVACEVKIIERAASVAEAVLEHVNAARAGLLAVGHRHSRKIENLILGSVSQKLVREAPCPVLTAPNRPKVD